MLFIFVEVYMDVFYKVYGDRRVLVSLFFEVFQYCRYLKIFDKVFFFQKGIILFFRNLVWSDVSFDILVIVYKMYYDSFFL